MRFSGGGRVLGLAVVVAVGLASSARSVEAGLLVNGSQVLNEVSIIPDQGSLVSIPSFAVVFAPTGTQTGDFSGAPTGALDSFTLVNDATSNIGTDFGSAAFGIFHITGESLLSHTESLDAFKFTGTFTPGTDSHWSLFSGAAPADLIISLIQLGDNEPIGAVATLHAFGKNDSPPNDPPANGRPNPEPGSLIVFGILGLIGGGWSWTRRRSRMAAMQS